MRESNRNSTMWAARLPILAMLGALATGAVAAGPAQFNATGELMLPQNYRE